MTEHYSGPHCPAGQCSGMAKGGHWGISGRERPGAGESHTRPPAWNAVVFSDHPTCCFDHSFCMALGPHQGLWVRPSLPLPVPLYSQARGQKNKLLKKGKKKRGLEPGPPACGGCCRILEEPCSPGYGVQILFPGITLSFSSHGIWGHGASRWYISVDHFTHSVQSFLFKHLS